MKILVTGSSGFVGKHLLAAMLRAGQARGLNLVDKLVRHRDNLRWEARKAVLQKRTSTEAPFIKRAVAMASMAFAA